MSLSAGDKLGPYEIVAPIGAGGMGDVYTARDTRLDRIVAVKVSTEQFSERFEREARAIAQLNHPNICQLYDVGPNYLVMEYIDGTPLKGPLPVDQTLKYATQICDAVDTAHKKGITHRDLKPGNILVTASGVKLLDFGLAKVATAKVPDAATHTMPLTEAGAIIGTAAYMSPEQAKGEQVDARSDIFSFGAVLYEMLSGRRAFARNSSIETMAAILRDEPTALDWPSNITAIITRCLRKAVGERFQTMGEVHAELEKAGTKPSEKSPSIAVLPFANMSRDPDDEYFSDGLAEEIINLLAHIPGLKVIARTSVFAFKGKNEDIRKIAEMLGVSSVLEGSVRRAGNRLRITGQLIHAADGTHLWSERFDREMTDVFAIQDEIAQAITAALKVTLSISPVRERYQPNLTAYETYLKARHHWAKVTPESLARAKEGFEQTIALDPQFAPAYVGLADYFLFLTVGAGLLSAREAMPRVRALAQKALDIDPRLSEAHAMLGIVAGVYDYDWKESERLFTLALAGDPVRPQVRTWHAWFYLLSVGRTKGAIEELERGLQEDPFNLIFRVMLAFPLMELSQLGDASTEWRRMLELDDNYWYGYLGWAWSHALRGMFAEALPLAEKAFSLAPWNTQVIGVFAAVLRRTGDASRSGEVLRRLRNSPEDYGAPRGLLIFHLLCGEMDQAADWLEKCIEQRDALAPRYPWYFESCSSQRWLALAKMMNLPD
jgi:serine/threonine-protein kinase